MYLLPRGQLPSSVSIATETWLWMWHYGTYVPMRHCQKSLSLLFLSPFQIHGWGRFHQAILIEQSHIMNFFT